MKINKFEVNNMNVFLNENNKFKTINLSLFFYGEIPLEKITHFNLLIRLMEGATKNYPSITAFSSMLNDNYKTKSSASINNYGLITIIDLSIKGINSCYLNEKNNERLFEILNEIVNNPFIEGKLFNEKYFEKQKELYIEFLKKRQDHKEVILDSKVKKLLGSDNPRGVEYVGDLDIAKTITNKQMYETYKELLKLNQEFYVSGNISQEEVITFVRKHCQHKLVNKELPSINYKQPIQVTGDFVEKGEFSQSSISLVYELPIYRDSPNWLHASLYLDVLNHVLFKKIREQLNFCYSIVASFYVTSGYLKINSNISNKNYLRAKEEINNLVNDLKLQIDNQVFSLMKEKMINKYRRISDMESIFDKIYFHHSLFNEQFNINETIEKIKKITINDVIEVAKKVAYKFSFILEEKNNED